MINISDRPRVLLSGEQLNYQIRVSLGAVESYLVERFGPTKDRLHLRQAPLVLYYCLGQHKLGPAPITEDFIAAAFEFAQSGSRNENTQGSLNLMLGYTVDPYYPPASVYTDLKRGLKLFLIHLWSQKAILLPLTYTPNSTLDADKKFLAEAEPPVSSFFRSYLTGTAQRPADAPPLSDANVWVLGHHAPRVIWTTGWHLFKDIQITELADLHAAYLQSMAGTLGYSLPSTPFPFQLMLAELLQCHPEVQFKQEDLDLYNRWLIDRLHFKEADSFQNYLLHQEQIKALREEEKEAAKQKAQEWHREYGRQRQRKKSSPKGPMGLEAAVAETTAALEAAATESDRGHAAIIACFAKLSGVQRGGLTWLEKQAPYPGREHIDLPKLSKAWKKAAESWLQSRKKMGYDKTDGQIAALNILYDYLFLYLPWWKELHPLSTLKLPLTPKDFTRYPFVDQTLLEDDESGNEAGKSEFALLKTLLEMIALRQPKEGSQYATIVQLEQFFKHIQKKFSRDEQMAGRDFENPIDREWDLPRQTRAGKTNKIPFSKHTYPHLLFYAYATEAFGLYLQQKAIEEDFFSTKSRRHVLVFDTAAYGYIPVIFYRRRCYPVFEVTNTYSIARRIVDTDAKGIAEVLHLLKDDVCGVTGVKEVWVPNLAVLRMIIGAIEMGLRMQSLQWLDRGTWDSLNPEPPDLMFSMDGPLSGEYAYDLLVPTDKTKDRAWVTRFTYRLREVFYREQLFQEAIREPDMDVRVDYEYIENNRFGKIWPLFRSNALPAPYSDQTYARAWRTFMAGFQFYLNTKTSHPTLEKRFEFPPPEQFVILLQLVPKLDDEGKPVVEGDHCPLRIALVHTPHACRATFASIRQGVLENSIIEALLGHVIGGRSTIYYQVALPEELAAGLERTDRANLDRALYPFDKKAHIRADGSDSAFVRAIHSDRRAAIHDFGLISGVVHWSLDELEKENTNDEGLRLFLESPLSQIVARETHVCPVGEQCPVEVVNKIGGFKRCGLCPLAVVGVDHLDAISAKKDELREVIEFEFRRIIRLQQDNSEPEAVLDGLWDDLDVIGLEWAGWKLLEEILLKKLELMRNDQEPFTYHAGAPDIVRRLISVTIKDVNQREAILKRLDGAYAFPSMEHEATLIQAAQLRSDLYAVLSLMVEGQTDGFDVPFVPAPQGDELTRLAYDIKNHVEPRGYRVEEILTRLDQLQQSPPQRLDQAQNNRFLISTEAIDAEVITAEAANNTSLPGQQSGNNGRTGDGE